MKLSPNQNHSFTAQPQYRYPTDQLYRSLKLILRENEIPPKYWTRLDKKLRILKRRKALRFENLDAQWLWRICAAQLMQGIYDYNGFELRNPWAWDISRKNWILPRWNGQPCKLLVLAEQGLGDEILFSSCFPDAIRSNYHTTVECDHRLIIPFMRSFSEFGSVKFVTRYNDESNRKPFQPHEYETRADIDVKKFDAFIPSGNLLKLYRTSREQVLNAPNPYLKPNKQYASEYRQQLSHYSKPHIGVAWAGRLAKLNSSDVCISSEEDCSFFNLDYVNPKNNKELETDDRAILVPQPTYDHTIALVSVLDRLQVITTTIAHVAGALGKEVHVIKPEPVYGEENNRLRWYYGCNNRTDWYPSMHVYRNVRQWLQLCRERKRAKRRAANKISAVT